MKNNKVKKFLSQAIETRSLRFQLLSRSLFLMAVILLLIGLFQYAFMREFIYENEASSIRTQILSISRDVWVQWILRAELEAGLNPGLNPGINDNENPKDYTPGRAPLNESNRVPFVLLDSTIAYVDPMGNLTVLSNMKAGAPPQLEKQEYSEAMMMKKRPGYKVVQANSEELLVVLQPLESRGYIIGAIQVSLSTKPLRNVLIRQLLIFLLLSLLALIGGLLTLGAVIKKTLVPLSNMVNTVEKIDAGNLAERVPAEQGQMEIDRLAVSFNGMLERLESSFEAEKEAKEQMRRFVADASHELRTPLTSIHGFLEVLLRGAMNQPEMLQRSLKSMYAESDRMKKLVQDLLLLAKLDRFPNMELKEGELNELILEMESQLRVLAGNREVHFELTPHIKCLFDIDKIKQVILNLFHNAVQHTDPEKGRIELVLKPADQGIELVVRDNGSGIPEEHLPHLFERFYRSESSRTRKSGGAGLGLAITQSIVELHGGSIRVESQVGVGSTFYVWLPGTEESDD